ncbi:hypothetical protein, partial [Thermincola ferriacetica]|uniref:hypothetical protein n=1 Tax=Thermincola ferriacetica TaxID=281456 RepID=UPI001A9A63D9
RLGGGRVDSVNDSEGLKSLFPAWTPETAISTERSFTLSPPVTLEQRLFYLHSGISFLQYNSIYAFFKY